MIVVNLTKEMGLKLPTGEGFMSQH